VKHRVTIDNDAGSGGPDHQLQAWEPQQNGYLWLEQNLQAEWPMEPDFSTAWRILESARIKSN
jgi:hypothetical protein